MSRFVWLAGVRRRRGVVPDTEDLTASGQFISDYVILSKEKNERPQHVVVGIELTTGIGAKTIPLEGDEF